MSILRTHVGLFAVVPISVLLANCNVVTSFTGPERINPVPSEVSRVKEYINSVNYDFPRSQNPTVDAKLAKLQRNNVIAARMYVIDMEYTEFEARLLREGQAIDFATKLTSTTLATVSGLVPLGGTSRALAESAALVSGLDTAYNEKVLKTQIIQNTIASMRTARHDQAAIIYANMYCPVEVYPIGFALSDLETYYRAGLFQTGLIKTSQVVLAAENLAKAAKDVNRPAATPASVGTVEGNRTEAEAKASATPSETEARYGNTLECRIPSGPRVGMQGPALPGPTASIRNKSFRDTVAASRDGRPVLQ